MLNLVLDKHKQGLTIFYDLFSRQHYFYWKNHDIYIVHRPR